VTDRTSTSTPEAAVQAAKWAAAGMSASLLVLAAMTELFDPSPRAPFLAIPAGLLGIVSVVIGHRVYEWMRSRLEKGASQAEASRTFFVATVAALGVTEAAGLFGLVAYLLSGHVGALTGLLTHVILAGAIWPSSDRYEAFVDS